MQSKVWAVVLFCLLSTLSVHSVQAQERTVALVYDDSGSMKDGGRWLYANYALQTLVGLLDKSDTLQLVTMSQPDEIRELDLSNRGGIMQTLQEQSQPGGSTPYDAVTTAIEALRETQTERKWLVVISDGKFDVSSATDLDDQVKDFRNTIGGQVIYLLVGDSEDEIEELKDQSAVQAWQSGAQATIYTAVGASDITQQLQQIAADVTTRTLGSAPNVQRRGVEIRLRSEFPLRRLTVLEQQPSSQTDLHVVKSAEAGGVSLPQLTQLDARMPSRSNRTLFGRITHIGRPQNQVIPPGSLTVSLDQPAPPDNFKILPEVAARLTTSLTAVGAGTLKKRKEVYTTCVNDTLRLGATLIAPSGDTLLQRVQNPGSIDISATMGQKDTPLTLASSGQSFAHTFTPPSDTTTISVSAQYPGYFNFKSRLYTIAASVCQTARALSLGSPVEPWTADVTEVPETPPLRVEPLADSKPIPPEEFEEWSIQVENQPSGVDLAVNRDSAASAWTMRPTLRWGFPQLTPTGSFPVTVQVSSPRTNEAPIERKVRFNIRDVSFWTLWGGVLLSLLALVILLVYLYGVYTKPRFPSGSYITYREQEDDPFEEDFELPTHWTNRYLVPFAPEAVETGFETVTFQAHRSQRIILPASQQVEGMKIGHLEIEEPGLRDKFLQPGATLTIPRTDHDRTPTYEYHNTPN